MAESTTDEHRPEGYDEDFVEAVDEDLQCLICHLPLKEPIQTRCGHRFCKDCLEEYIRRYKFMINKILPIMDPCNLVLILFNHSSLSEEFLEPPSQLSLRVENFYYTQQEEIIKANIGISDVALNL